MWRLYHFTLCPFSRKVRFALAVKGVTHELVLERPWEKRSGFTQLNPAGQTPVMSLGGTVLVDSVAIIEHFEEVVERTGLLGATPEARAETRRLVAWFDQKFYAEVGAPLLAERMYKRTVLRGSPDGGVLREAGRMADIHLDYVDYLLERRAWLGGNQFGMADIAAAAHLSVADYLSGIDWDGHEPAKTWYSAIKSRPTFRPLLAERLEGLPPPAHYDKLDF
ncbi:glutathione S-transferase family protein [Sandarakinorhabdus rubra]|uniref:glutathione S-transferase family protein n=1 Tax=Sandarakinorhabdus rubra TaxID=2672568 RepID=UPI0013DB6795|nr:glutathione S-transferase family protein [Sandarakinorhabdus rubra]